MSRARGVDHGPEEILERVRELADLAPVLIWTAGPDGQFTFVNRTWQTFTGRRLEDALGAGWIDDLHPDDRERCSAEYREALAACRPFEIDLRLRGAGGAHRWLRLGGSPRVDARGDLEGFVGAGVDVTEWKEVEVGLSRATARTGLILESAGEGIIGLDANGDQTFVNPAAARLLGYEPFELIHQRSHSLWHHTRRDGSPYPREECPVYAAFRDGLVHRSAEEVFWRKDGTSFLVDYVSTPIRERDELVGAVVVFRDITKEARLESIAEAVETMNNLGYVFSAVRHELGNPVNSVKTALAVLRRNLDRFPPETVRDYLDRSLAELSRVEDLLLSLKSFSLYEHVKSQPLPVNQFLEQFVALARPDLLAKGISLEFRPAPGPGLAHANTRALEQVLLNCLANAVDALEGRERRVIAIETALTEELLEIRVEDSGCGMSPEALKSLFRPFHTTKPSGTGLGLVIAKKMIARMEGTISVESDVGSGTRVILALRREAPAS